MKNLIATKTGGGSCVRSLKAVGFAALASGSIALFGSSLAHAAVLSAGAPNPPYGGGTCADVPAASLTPAANPLQAWGCHAGPNQQYQIIYDHIYALGGQRCVGTTQNASGLTFAGAKVLSEPCNTSDRTQNWYFDGGEFINYAGPSAGFGNALCLDAGNGDGAPLIMWYCGQPLSSNSQNWQIK